MTGLAIAPEAKASNLRQLLGEQRKWIDGRPRPPSTRMTPSRHQAGGNPAAQRAPDYHRQIHYAGGVPG